MVTPLIVVRSMLRSVLSEPLIDLASFARRVIETWPGLTMGAGEILTSLKET